MRRTSIFNWIFAGGMILCLFASCLVGGYAYINRDAIMSRIPMIPTKGGPIDPIVDHVVDGILTPQPADTLMPGQPSLTPNPSTPTPTPMPVDKLRIMVPRNLDFQDAIRRANVVQGKNVLLLESGVNLYGTHTFRDTREQAVPMPFPIYLVFGGKKIEVVDETFTSTVDVAIDEAIYLPAVLSQATVLPNLLDEKVHVLITNEQGLDEIVEMDTGTVIIPLASTCWTGFGMDPWGNRQEPGATKRYEKIWDAAYWNIQAWTTGDTYAEWALPRYRWTSIIASYNAIMPLNGASRSWSVLDEIHNGSSAKGIIGSVARLTTSSGQFATPNAYDLLLAHFNQYAKQYNFAEITAIRFTAIQRGNVICASDKPLMDAQLESLLNGPVPSNLLINPADLRPEIQP